MSGPHGVPVGTNGVRNGAPGPGRPHHAPGRPCPGSDGAGLPGT